MNRYFALGVFCLVLLFYLKLKFKSKQLQIHKLLGSGIGLVVQATDAPLFALLLDDCTVLLNSLDLWIRAIQRHSANQLHYDKRHIPNSGWKR